MSHFRNRLLTLLVVCCRVSDDLSLVSCVPSTDPDYDKRVRPNEGVSHEKVEIGLFLNSIRTVSEADMTVVLDLFVQASWKDSRLESTWLMIHENIHGSNHSECSEDMCDNRITMGRDFADVIWKPDFYFQTAVSIVPADDQNDNVCVRFDRDGSIFYSVRYILTTSCPMQMFFFPLDSHKCNIRIGTYKYNDKQVKLHISPLLSGMYPRQETANFKFADFLLSRDYENITNPYLGDLFTEHVLWLRMSRKYHIYLLTTYLPSSSLAVLNWVNFWIDPKCTAERAGLTITLSLAQIVLLVGTAQRFPSVSDFKMVDLYLIVCFLFQVACLVETVLAAVLFRNGEKANTKRKHEERDKVVLQLHSTANNSKNGLTSTDHEDDADELKFSPSPEKHPLDNEVDQISRIVFPSAFILWNLLFFGLSFHFAN
ncbi:glycine receptor subunit alpha-2-like [Symsagittifera roscoffensis]|uniref:glycine receptor subunit alpha-2-like n=1 Tax=Symsagittifera roscoffensis TaxID=84072 RepID=UPI00307C9C8F